MHDFEIENGFLRKYHGSGGVVKIPEGVKFISDAFDDLEHISEIILPESICQVTLHDFNSKAEAQVKAKFTDEDGFCRIGKFILDYSGDAEEIVIPEGIQQINHCIFANSKVKSVVFPKSMKTAFGFANCPNLERVQFNEGLQHIGRQAFSTCPKLKDVKIPGSVISVGEGAFRGCESVVTNGSFLTVQDVLLKYTGDDSVLVVPDGIRVIAERALGGRQFVEVKLPESLEVIGERAFGSCSKLESIKIPQSVKFIYRDTFWGCISLERAELPPIVSVPEGMFAMCESLSQVILEYGTEEICDGAFSSCKALKNIGIPGSVRRLGEFRNKTDGYFIRGCFEFSGLEMVILPNGLEEIGAQCFDSCVDLKKINIPLTLKKIGCRAFSNCRKLEHFIVPDSVEDVGEELFFNCLNFLNTDNRGREEADRSGGLVYDRRKYVIENKKLEKYVGDDLRIVIPEGVEVIGKDAFNRYIYGSRIQEFVFPESLKNIEENAFGWGWGDHLIANLPNGYLQQTSKLNAEMVIRMVKAPWRDYVTVDDWAALYLFQSGKKISEFCAPYAEKNPEETMEAMCRLLDEKGKAKHFDVAVNFWIEHRNKISDKTYSRLCLILNKKKATKALQRLSEVWDGKKTEGQQNMPEEKRRDIYCDCEYMRPFLPETKAALKAKTVKIKQNGIEFTVNMKAGSVLKRLIKSFGCHDLYTAMEYLMSREEVIDLYDPKRNSDFFAFATPELRDGTPRLDEASLELRRAFIFDVYRLISDDKVLEEILRSAPKKKDGKLAMRKYTRIACAGLCSEDAQVLEIVAQAEDDKTLVVTPRTAQLSHDEFEKIKDDFLSNHSSLCLSHITR